MTRRLLLVALVALVVLSGCMGTPGGGDETAASDGADVQLSSIGQQPADNGSAVEVIGAATNYGEGSADATATVTLLNGSDTAGERRISLGMLAPDETATFSVTVGADPDTVDGRRITFD